nr:immunoglobulin light chain junction region [Macaca mulatta]MOY06982.1 immunoglobulin light chain junction region [Macaca mulatta]
DYYCSIWHSTTVLF